MNRATAILLLVGTIAASLAGVTQSTSKQPSRAPAETSGETALLRDDAGLGKTADGQLLLRYTVECALPSDDRLQTSAENKGVVLHGAIGLAPTWKTQALTEPEQRWLSACILARINAFGVTVQFSLRGEHRALRDSLTRPEQRDYSFEEGAFYGNFFADPPVTFACRGQGGKTPAPSRQQRVCTEPADGDAGISRCGMQIVGECANVCEVHDRKQGYYSRCTGAGTLYQEVATVFLRGD